MFYKLRQSTWTKRVALIAVAALAMTLLAACGKSSKEPSIEFQGVQDGTVVATYEGGTVTDLEFNKFKGIFALTQPGVEGLLDLPMFQEMLLEQLVVYKILGSKANDEQLKTAKEASDTQLESYKEYIKTDANAAALAETKGISEDDMATFLYLTSAINAFVEDEITSEAVQAEYEDKKADYTVSDVRHVLVSLEVMDPETGEVTKTRTEAEALARANEAKQKLESGSSWEEIAKEYSDDPGSKDNGGLYENYPGGTWVEEFKQAAFMQPVNEIGEPVLTSFGYHVIEVVKRDIKEFADLDEATIATIRGLLTNRYIETFVAEQLPSYNVVMTLPEPEETETPEESTEPATEGDDQSADEQTNENTEAK